MECPSITSTGYGEFSSRIHAKAGSRRLPLEGSIEITERCNMQCAHCFINQPAGDQNARNLELPVSKWCALLDQIVERGCLWLLFTGGEPFLRPDFLEIYMYAKQKGLLITIFTNGTLLTPEIVDQLAEYPPFSIEISLYGYTAEAYERVTGIPGSHAQCLRGIDLLRERSLPLKLKAVLMNANQHELDAMKIFAERLGVDFRYDVELNLRLDGEQAPAVQRLSPEKVIKLDFADQKRQKEWQEFSGKFATLPEQSDKLFRCGAGIGSFHIDATGRLTPCLMVRQPSYDLCRGTFYEGWFDFIPKVLSQVRTKESACIGCDVQALCSWCPGWAQMEHGDQEEPIEYLCQITHLRSKVLKSLSSNPQ